MSISYTNHFKVIYDEVKARIIAEFPRFKNKNRILFKDINDKDLGSEDTIFIAPLIDNEEGEDTAGRTSIYILELTYLKKIHPTIKYDEITDVAEHIKQLFGADNYRHHRTGATEYWYYCDVLVINYAPEMPEEIENVYGFAMTLEIHKAQYQT